MKKIFNSTVKLFLTGAVFLASCSKNIDLVPSDTIPSESALENYQDYDKAVIGAYSNIAYQQTINVNTVLADESRWAIDNNARNYSAGAHKWAFDAGEATATDGWGNLYNVIDRVNRALALYDNITTTTAEEASALPRLKGELHAIRAFAHFELLRWFTEEFTPTSLGVPAMTASTVTGKPARNTWAEVMTLIQADLSEADQLIPSAFTDIFRITKPAVAAIRARVALYNKDWANAITYANQALASKGTLATGETYNGIWTDANTSEVFFQLRRNSNSGSIRTLWTDDNTDVFFSPSYKLMATFDQTNDIRYARFFMDDTSVPVTRENWKVNKYPGQNATNRFNNIKVYRVSEMYLILAEAYAETNNLAEGTSRLNALRAARINGYTSQAFANANALIEAVYLERYKELAFEGHRFFDLRRRNLPVVRTAQDIASGAAIPLQLNTSDRNYILPIPQSEIFANENIVQNRGYGMN
ncbi:RagB/SusD family nutrient uptake outer membrane protein [Sphingobacterium griseoflavum]|uniref:Membrane protein n=1 Tax=Sphingobacterium griseoflavum TaxID=1474952 RepID=A0ABQ3HY58_9SPHI|nr:RagB/SusD family nutrient uptake outer membrane protein [Sphingobacterium griseoflavum]GHE37521.1 membrane protein [Sphingobacterium griseoflavum]